MWVANLSRSWPGHTPAVIVAAGIAAAMHVGKLPPAMPALREQLGMTLVQASLMVSAFQVAGLSMGIIGGTLADRFGARRVMLLGLVILAIASLGALATHEPVGLLVTRAIESAGFILAVLPGPVLLRRCVPVTRINVWLGWWGAYMPIGMGSALFAAPWLMQIGGWRTLWALTAAVCVALAALVWVSVPADSAHRGSHDAPSVRWLIGVTIQSPGPWVLALAFCCYAAQWMGLFSFLPTVYQAAGLDARLAAALTAVATTANLLGNLAGGRLAHRQVPPYRTLALAACAMALGAWLAYGSGAPLAIRYGGVLMLTIVGGLIPGTLFTIAPVLAPSAAAISTTVGLMQQGSTLGQFVSAPLLAWVAGAQAHWERSWIVTVAFAMGELVAAALLWRLWHVKRPQRA